MYSNIHISRKTLYAKYPIAYKYVYTIFLLNLAIWTLRFSDWILELF